VSEGRAEVLDFLNGIRRGEQPHTWIGDVPDWGQQIFGGMVVGHAAMALTRDAPEGRRLHSMHAYYVRPTNGGAPITYEIEPIRDGQRFSTRRFTASQHGKVTFDGTCSYTADTDGYVYDQPHTSPLPPREGIANDWGPDVFESVVLGPTAPDADGIYESTERKWLRVPGIDGDIHLHTALLGVASDWTGIGARPRMLSWPESGEYGIASLDHAVWFHRPSDITQWHYSDMHALVNYGGRSHIRMTIRDEQGRVVVSVGQELLVKVLD
jgi:acyl-CoA thioesterase II